MGRRRGRPRRYLLRRAADTDRENMNDIKRILLVEDDPKDVELTLAGLTDYNLANEVIVTRDGEEALDYLRRTGKYQTRPHGNPAVMLLDLKQPLAVGETVPLTLTFEKAGAVEVRASVESASASADRK